MIGRVFGRLTVLADSGERDHKAIVWNCRCECGNEPSVRGAHLRSGRTLSCGCLHKQVAAASKYKHGMSRMPEYNIWNQMRRGWDIKRAVTGTSEKA